VPDILPTGYPAGYPANFQYPDPAPDMKKHAGYPVPTKIVKNALKAIIPCIFRAREREINKFTIKKMSMSLERGNRSFIFY